MPGTPRGILEKRLQLTHWRALLHILRELADPGGDRSRHDVREHRAAVSDGQLSRGPSPDACDRLVRRRRRRGDTIPDGTVYQVTSMLETRPAAGRQKNTGKAECRESGLK